jgi:predicted AlkP superfamily pyrophosphatase or phosphodiesterase
VPDSDVLLHLYADNPSYIHPTYTALKKQAIDFDVYLANEIPARWHYSSSDDWYHRIGDMILVPKPPKAFNIRHKKVSPGKHGYDNALPQMRATFYAWGPAFKQHLQIDMFENVNVYPLVAKILGLNITGKIDGSLHVLQPVLK